MLWGDKRQGTQRRLHIASSLPTGRLHTIKLPAVTSVRPHMLSGTQHSVTQCHSNRAVQVQSHLPYTASVVPQAKHQSARAWPIPATAPPPCPPVLPPPPSVAPPKPSKNVSQVKRHIHAPQRIQPAHGSSAAFASTAPPPPHPPQSTPLTLLNAMRHAPCPQVTPQRSPFWHPHPQPYHHPFASPPPPSPAPCAMPPAHSTTPLPLVPSLATISSSICQPPSPLPRSLLARH